MTSLYYDINDFIEENNISHFTEINIPVNSFSSSSVYNVSIFYQKNLNKYKITCSCGEKFNVGKRKKCKHINNVLNSMYKDIEYTKNNIFKDYIIAKGSENKPFPSLNNIFDILDQINKDIEEDDIFNKNIENLYAMDIC
jgi:hypothetical protein